MSLLDFVPSAAMRWERHWRGMPEFVQGEKPPFASVDVRFYKAGDYWAFRRLIAAYGHFFGKASRRVKPSMQFTTSKVRSRLVWVDCGEPVLPKYPIYIVSKGRGGRQLTSRALQYMRVPHYVVVERQELEKYAAHKMPLATLLVLDPQYQLDYAACDDLGMTKSKGPGPARNFAWEHSIANGHAWHWVMDDNIQSFYRFWRNRRVPVKSGAIFRAMETFCERYENVYMAGPQYSMFAPDRQKHPAFITNTRVYSCNLIRNDIPYRWRGRYNEDTDLSLRILKDGNSTVEFVAFLQQKVGTQRLAGGNTAEFYAKEGTAPKSEMLKRMHPDVTEIGKRWGRDHHYVNYAPFAGNKLQLRPGGVVLPDKPNEFGMVQQPVLRQLRMSPPVSRNLRTDQTPGPPPGAIRVHFNSRADVENFAAITGLHVEDGGVVWFPAPL